MSWVKQLIEDKGSKKKLFPHIKNKRLLELCALTYAFYYDESREPAKSLIKRAYQNNNFPNRSGIAFELQPNDVTAVLGCSDRKAMEYISVLRAVYLGI